MYEVRRTDEDSIQLLDKLMQQLSEDKVASHNWNTTSLVLLYAALVIIIILELENVNVGIVSAVAAMSLIGFITFNRVNSIKMRKKAIPQSKIDGYREFLMSGKHSGEDGANAINTMLSPRETQILQLIAEGNINKQIAKQLGLSPATVRNHVSRLMQKMDVNDRTAAAVMALSNGWIDMDRPVKPNDTKKVCRNNGDPIDTR